MDATSAKTLLAAAPAGGEDCEIAQIAEFLDRPRPFGDRARIIATHVDWGPELLYRTRHAVLAAPYHRNASGILDIYRVFSALNPAASKTIVDARGIELVLLCPSPRERLFYGGEVEGVTLYQRLLEGRPPPWLAPVALPDAARREFPPVPRRALTPVRSVGRRASVWGVAPSEPQCATRQGCHQIGRAEGQRERERGVCTQASEGE